MNSPATIETMSPSRPALEKLASRHSALFGAAALAIFNAGQAAAHVDVNPAHEKPATLISVAGAAAAHSNLLSTRQA